MSFVLHRPFLGLFQKEYSAERRCNLCMKCLTTEIKWNKKAKNLKGEKKKRPDNYAYKTRYGCCSDICIRETILCLF